MMKQSMRNGYSSTNRMVEEWSVVLYQM